MSDVPDPIPAGSVNCIIVKTATMPATQTKTAVVATEDSKMPALPLIPLPTTVCLQNLLIPSKTLKTHATVSSPEKKTKPKSNTVRSSPRVISRNPCIIGPLCSPPGKSTRSVSKASVQKRIFPKTVKKTNKSNKKQRTNTAPSTTPSNAAAIAEAQALAESIANAQAITNEGKQRIVTEKDMITLTKRVSNHHGFSQIWHLGIAKDADLDAKVKAMFLDPRKSFFML
jgi:hypothetical protein